MHGPVSSDGYWQNERDFEAISDELRERSFTIVAVQDCGGAPSARRGCGE